MGRSHTRHGAAVSVRVCMSMYLGVYVCILGVYVCILGVCVYIGCICVYLGCHTRR